MEKEKIQKIKEIIQKECSFIQLSQVDPDAPLKDTVDIDSMQLVGVIARLETELEIEIPFSAMEAQTLNEFINLVAKQNTNKLKS